MVILVIVHLVFLDLVPPPVSQVFQDLVVSLDSQVLVLPVSLDLVHLLDSQDIQVLYKALPDLADTPGSVVLVLLDSLDLVPRPASVDSLLLLDLVV